MTRVTVESTARLLKKRRAKAMKEAQMLQGNGSLAAAKWEYGYACAMDYALERLEAIRISRGWPRQVHDSSERSKGC